MSETQQSLPRAYWNHVKSSANPAYCASRGSLVKNLIESQLRWYGPEWLAKPNIAWPQFSVPLTTENHEEIESQKILCPLRHRLIRTATAIF